MPETSAALLSDRVADDRRHGPVQLDPAAARAGSEPSWRPEWACMVAGRPSPAASLLLRSQPNCVAGSVFTVVVPRFADPVMAAAISANAPASADSGCETTTGIPRFPARVTRIVSAAMKWSIGPKAARKSLVLK